MATTTHTIDAAGKPLGRIATEAASVLMGKHSTAFARNKTADVTVHIANASKMRMTERKSLQTTHRRYSGYPGGLKTETLSALIARRGYSEALKKAIRGMIPNNRLRPIVLKNLSIAE
jgi:large subunit ribosomal protein L13